MHIIHVVGGSIGCECASSGATARVGRLLRHAVSEEQSLWQPKGFGVSNSPAMVLAD
jgi:hypothetical protein